jgi:phosphoesterase RecJ-like protein
MINRSDYQKAVELVDDAGSILATTHTRPDGDACGCMAALSEALTALGKEVTLLLISPMPQWYEFLFEKKVPVLGEDVSVEQLTQGSFGDFDLLIIVDTNSRSQLLEFEQYVKQTDRPILVIDHHVTSDGLGDVELVDPDAAAAAVILHDLFKHADWPITEKIARALLVAIATDTGWFQFSNTDSRVLRTCAQLIDSGADPRQLYHDLYENFSPQRFKLMVAMLNTLELHLDGRYATQYLRVSDFEQTGASYTDTENLINECQRIGTVQVTALFVELRDGRIRCSLRSRGAVNVSEIAGKFGGGGHKMAAGTYLPGPLENAKKQIYDEIEKHLR